MRIEDITIPGIGPINVIIIWNFKNWFVLKVCWDFHHCPYLVMFVNFIIT